MCSASCVPLCSPATSLLSINCASVSGCSPVSAIVAGGGGGTGCAAAELVSRVAGAANAVMGGPPRAQAGGGGPQPCRTLQGFPRAVPARPPCRDAAAAVA